MFTRKESSLCLEPQQATMLLPFGSLLPREVAALWTKWFSNGKQGGHHFGLGESNSVPPLLPFNPKMCSPLSLFPTEHQRPGHNFSVFFLNPHPRISLLVVVLCCVCLVFREREREKETWIACLLHVPPPGIEPET